MALNVLAEWFGWNSTTPIGAVEFTGFYASVDSVQIKVPEPNTCLILTAAVLPALLRPRRNIS